jgi:DNA-binding MarR family transcriptional regulator/GNAT superfamily N-acetyltransferase
MAIELTEADSAGHIPSLRAFNRFYTLRLGLLRRYHLDGKFSLTEARVLYEVGSRPRLTASVIRGELGLDAGYLSRLLSGLSAKKFLRQSRSFKDRREKLLELTTSGKNALSVINDLSDRHAERMVEHLPASDRKKLVGLLEQAGKLLQPRRQAVRIERRFSIDQGALELLHEYYEAVDVVQRDRPEVLKQAIKLGTASLWLAFHDRQPVGCVLLRALPRKSAAIECKRLYVRPAARGEGVANALMDALEHSARETNMKWVYLDSYSGLQSAIALYKKRGYHRCRRYNDNPQATLFMRKRLV